MVFVVFSSCGRAGSAVHALPPPSAVVVSPIKTYRHDGNVALARASRQQHSSTVYAAFTTLGASRRRPRGGYATRRRCNKHTAHTVGNQSHRTHVVSSTPLRDRVRRIYFRNSIHRRRTAVVVVRSNTVATAPSQYYNITIFKRARACVRTGISRGKILYGNRFPAVLAVVE